MVGVCMDDQVITVEVHWRFVGFASGGMESPDEYPLLLWLLFMSLSLDVSSK